MANATVRWAGGQTYIGTDSTHHSAVLSTPNDGVGIKPSDLLLIAIGACASVDLVDILAKKKICLTSLDVNVTGEQDSDPPWTFRKLHSHFRLRGKGLTEKAVDHAIHLAEEKYCSVASTVRPTAETSYSFELIHEEY
ncbi:MAG TPA: OsmC family protein [Anaerolineales bacterium]